MLNLFSSPSDPLSFKALGVCVCLKDMDVWIYAFPQCQRKKVAKNLGNVGEGKGQVQQKRVNQGKVEVSTWVTTESQSEAGQGTRDYEEMKSGWGNAFEGMREGRHEGKETWVLISLHSRS